MIYSVSVIRMTWDYTNHPIFETVRSMFEGQIMIIPNYNTLSPFANADKPKTVSKLSNTTPPHLRAPREYPMKTLRLSKRQDFRNPFLISCTNFSRKLRPNLIFAKRFDDIFRPRP